MFSWDQYRRVHALDTHVPYSPLLHGGGVEEGGRMGCEREGTYRYNQVGTEGPRGKGMSSRHGATDCGGCMDGKGS